MNTPSWYSSVYQQTVLIVLSFLFFSGSIVYFFRNKNYYFKVSWASIKSWLIAAPILFACIGAPEPWPLVALTMLGLLGAKIFFQILGMYHRSWFVIICYAGIIGLALSVYHERTDLYNLMPMLVLGLCCFVPIAMNRFKHMIQYIALTMMCFIFLGWSFMHAGLIMRFDNGIYQLMYLIILTEFCDNTILAISRYVGRIHFVSNINPRRTMESTGVSIVITLILAFLMRHLLPVQSEKYWLTAGLIAGLGGGFGDIVMTVIRRDLGIRDYGVFILGRGNFLDRMDRLIFVCPIYYYVMHYVAHMM
jgi:phosphatidate cytidylyltransferase